MLDRQAEPPPDRNPSCVAAEESGRRLARAVLESMDAIKLDARVTGYLVDALDDRAGSFHEDAAQRDCFVFLINSTNGSRSERRGLFSTDWRADLLRDEQQIVRVACAKRRLERGIGRPIGCRHAVIKQNAEYPITEPAQTVMDRSAVRRGL